MLAAVFSVATAAAHQIGWHKTLQFVVRPDSMTLLLTIDSPRGKESLLQRANADRNGDRVLDADERQVLKAALMKLGMKSLQIKRGDVPATWSVEEAKVDVRGSTAVDETPVSMAVVLAASGGQGALQIADPFRCHSRLEDRHHHLRLLLALPHGPAAPERQISFPMNTLKGWLACAPNAAISEKPARE